MWRMEKISVLRWIDIFRTIPDELQTAMILAFEQVWRDEEQRAAYGFYLRFGEGSHRWALKPEDIELALERQNAAQAAQAA